MADLSRKLQQMLWWSFHLSLRLMFLFVFSFSHRETKSHSSEMQLKGGACWRHTYLPGTVRIPKDLQTQCLPEVCSACSNPKIKMIFPDVVVCLVAEFHGGICKKTVAQMVITLLLLWPQRGIRHRGLIPKNTVWGRINLRAPGKECGVKRSSVPPIAFWLVIAVRWLPDSCKRPRWLYCVAVTCVSRCWVNSVSEMCAHSTPTEGCAV